ncbi:hypothetical protein ACN47E_009917 [Coniothyrium glycines]
MLTTLQSLSLMLCMAPAYSLAKPFPSAEHLSHFNLAEARANRLSDITHTHDLTTRDVLSHFSLRAMRARSGSEAIVDESLMHRGALSATGADFVDLSWDPLSPTTSYMITRDGDALVTLSPGTTSYRDITVTPGSTYRYDIIPVLAETTPNDDIERWSLQVHIAPSDTNITTHISSLAARAAPTTTLSWITFIPEARINAPTVAGVALCGYGSGYQFGGDGHGFDWTASSYRTAAHALITWSNKAVTGHTAVGTTHVYEKSSGKLVSHKTASKADMVVKKLPAAVGESVDIRMVTHAKNPYCPAGAIDGAFTATVTKSGSWSIRSGEHRLMPNHHVYIYDGGKVTDVYKRKYANAACLVGAATCQLASMGGLYGTY